MKPDATTARPDAEERLDPPVAGDSRVAAGEDALAGSALEAILAMHHSVHCETEVSRVAQRVLEFAPIVSGCDAAALFVAAGEGEARFELYTALPGRSDDIGEGSLATIDPSGIAAADAEAPSSSAEGAGSAAFLGVLVEAGMRSARCIPLRAHGEFCGVLALGRRASGGFEAANEPVVNGLANAAGIAIWNARMAQRTEMLANFDSLTGLINRRIFFDRLSQVLSAAERSDHMAAVCFIDLDNFKRVNDTVGHMAGDRVLRQMSQRLVSCLRQSDSVCRLPSEVAAAADDASVEGGPTAPDGSISRLGGDEFAVVLSKIATPRDAALVAKRIAKIFEAPYTIDGREAFLSASIGIAIYPFDGRDAGTLVRNADTAMYCAKKRGKNGFQYYTKSMNAEASRKLHIETRLRSALERNEFALFYQQQRDAKTGELVGAEVLLRWDDPEMGLVSPAEFVPLAEETGCMIPIGEWVLRAACHQLREWQRSGYHDLRLAVNLSAQQLHQPEFLTTMREILAETGIGTGQLELEITETTLMEDDDTTMRNLEGLHDMGIELALDDFGTGYSSLSYLRRLALDIVKIDRSFVSGLPESGDDQALTEAIVAMAHSLGLRVVAEGVETEDQVHYLREIGCDQLQGFLFGRPVPAGQFEALLAKKTEEES